MCKEFWQFLHNWSWLHLFHKSEIFCGSKCILTTKNAMQKMSLLFLSPTKLQNIQPHVRFTNKFSVFILHRFGSFELVRQSFASKPIKMIIKHRRSMLKRMEVKCLNNFTNSHSKTRTTWLLWCLHEIPALVKLSMETRWDGGRGVKKTEQLWSTKEYECLHFVSRLMCMRMCVCWGRRSTKWLFERHVSTVFDCPFWHLSTFQCSNEWIPVKETCLFNIYWLSQ